MKGSRKVGLQKDPPARRGRSGFASVVFGMLCGIIVFGGILVVLNEVRPPTGQGDAAPEVPVDDEKSGLDAPKVAIEDDKKRDSADGATTTAPESAAGSVKEDDTTAGNKATDDAPVTLPASDNETPPKDPPEAGPEPESTPTVTEVVPEIKLSGPASRVNARAFNGPENAGLLSVVLYGGSETLTAGSSVDIGDATDPWRSALTGQTALL